MPPRHTDNLEILGLAAQTKEAVWIRRTFRTPHLNHHIDQAEVERSNSSCAAFGPEYKFWETFPYWDTMLAFTTPWNRSLKVCWFLLLQLTEKQTLWFRFNFLVSQQMQHFYCVFFYCLLISASILIFKWPETIVLYQQAGQMSGFECVHINGLSSVYK